MHDLIDLSQAERVAVDPAPTVVMRHFCQAVAAAICGLPVEQVPGRVAELLPGALTAPNLLTKAQSRAPAEGYGRNRVFICPRDRFSVLAMVWPPGISTPIHDHRDWCALGVYKGEIEETRYDPADQSSGCAAAVPRETIRHRTGAIAHLPVMETNIHRIHNPTGEIAISVHVYGGNCETRGPNLRKVYVLAP